MNKLEELIIHTLDIHPHCNIPIDFSSINELNKKVASDYLLVGPGDDAAVYRVRGTKVILVEKMESHNSPSIIDLYNAAATCPGRAAAGDVVAMGGRPIAVMNCLNVGEPDEKVLIGPCGFEKECSCGRCGWMTNQERINEALRAMADICETLGTPIIGGGVSTSLDGKIPAIVGHVTGVLVSKRPVTKPAKNSGDKVILIGLTGNDGNDSLFRAGFFKEMKPAQALFKEEKICMEATLAAMKTNKVKSAADLGAGGIAVAVCETARKGHLGAEMDLDQVILKSGLIMSPEEIALCETQGRMLITVHPRNEEKILEIIKKQDGVAQTIGKITKENKTIFKYKDEPIAIIPEREEALDLTDK